MFLDISIFLEVRCTQMYNVRLQAWSKDSVLYMVECDLVIQFLVVACCGWKGQSRDLDLSQIAFLSIVFRRE